MANYLTIAEKHLRSTEEEINLSGLESEVKPKQLGNIVHVQFTEPGKSAPIHVVKIDDENRPQTLTLNYESLVT